MTKKPFTREECDAAAVNSPYIPPIPAEELIARGVTQLELLDGRTIQLELGVEIALGELSDAGYAALGRVNSFFSDTSREQTIKQGFALMRVVGERTPAHQKAYNKLRDHQGLFYPRPADELISKGLGTLELVDGMTVQLTSETELTIGELSRNAVEQIDQVFGLDNLVHRWRTAHDTEKLEEELDMVISDRKVSLAREIKVVGPRK